MLRRYYSIPQSSALFNVDYKIYFFFIETAFEVSVVLQGF